MFPPYPTSDPAPRMGGVRRAERPAAAQPGTQDVRQPTPRRSWRDKVRHAVDLTVAFVTLEDAHPGLDDPSDASAAPARASVDDRHPHRKPLRSMPRSRRPGAAAHRPQICTAPVGATPSAAPKRRTRLT
jgi:hypothetical protein